MQEIKKRRIEEEGLRISHQLLKDREPQGLQEAAQLAQLAQAAVQGRGVKPRHPWEEVGEEALGVAQEGALALDAPKLLGEGKREDLRVREPLERLLAPRAWIEQRG